MTSDWRSYPFQLVPGDSQLDFPAAEGQHADQESDTWFIAGELTSVDTDRSFAFLTIFNRNRPGGSIVADFYTLALFDLDSGEYGTYTDYDMPPASMEPGATPKLASAVGHLDLEYNTGDPGVARWTTVRDADGTLLPYTYDVSLVGIDQAGQPMRLDLRVTPTRAPTPLGASAYNGKIACFGQDDTYSYFQTGMAMTGTLCWGEAEERVSGTAGHVDRQWFPKYAGGGTGEPPRTRSHEWRTINFDNGVDMSIWRQFLRTEGNALQPFTGITISHPDATPPGCVEDFEVTISSYVRWPDVIRPLIRPPARARYLPDRHRITCAALQLDIEGEPLVLAPAHGLPIEYMEGPYRYRGTLAGEPVTAFAFNERSLALYRDWELVQVLACAVAQEPDVQLESTVDRLRPLLASGRRDEARELVQAAMAGASSCRDVLEALEVSLSDDKGGD
ncbi:secreted hydrolase [Mycobacterium asiaticum]|uniref:Secreted hydrolase n=1 Tax=Mycobacterium asiaticum TaxID=1790 RepID=A0A1A3P6V9_MYCAS|nr:lipocalin-like domain-containing protein [Mycobacterium asiaticum]OBK28322.1 secreted hydrolase [Mycobacterium asiaticum]